MYQVSINSSTVTFDSCLFERHKKELLLSDQFREACGSNYLRTVDFSVRSISWYVTRNHIITGYFCNGCVLCECFGVSLLIFALRSGPHVGIESQILGEKVFRWDTKSPAKMIIFAWSQNIRQIIHMTFLSCL